MKSISLSSHEQVFIVIESVEVRSNPHWTLQILDNARCEENCDSILNKYTDRSIYEHKLKTQVCEYDSADKTLYNPGCE